MREEKSVETELRELEERLVSPDVRQSKDAVAELLAESFVEFGSSGRVFNKQTVIEALSRESDVRFAISEFKVVQLSQNTALATYVATRRGASEQQGVRSLRSTVWQHQEGRWRAVFHQGTTVGGESAF